MYITVLSQDDKTYVFTSIQSLIIFPKYLIKIYIMCYMFDINMVRAPVIIRLNFNPNLLLATPTPIPD